MKKNCLLALSLCLCVILFAGCQKTANNISSTDISESHSNSSDLEELEIDKGLLDVKITIPASMAGENPSSTLTDEQKTQGFKSVTKNADGSLTFVISKSAHKKLMDDMKKTTAESLNSLITSGDYASYKKMEFNDDFSKITLTVDEEKFSNSFDSIGTLAIGTAAGMYQAFDGRDAAKLSVAIEVKSESTGKVFKTINFPES